MLKTSSDVCSVISEWWTDGRRNDIFSMSDGVMISTGYGGGPLVKEWNVAIVPKLDVLDLMYTDTKAWKEWTVCVEQSNKNFNEPIMFFIHKNKYLYIVISDRYLSYLENFFGSKSNVLLFKYSGFCVMGFGTFANWSINMKLTFKRGKD